jgi:thiol-disulfide isomerase/thioredoxin
MNKKRWIIFGIMGAMIFLLGIGYLFFSQTPNSDALKFKEEYEKLNGTIRESDGALYNSIEVPRDNPIQYVNCAEALDVLKQKTAILYIGANWCPWCRNAIPVLFEVAKREHIDTIYYLNLDEEKDMFEIQKGNLVKTVNGSVGYYQLLEFLESHLRDYVLTDEKGVTYDTGEKRIYMPSVITSKNGVIQDIHVGTVSLETNQTKYSLMTTSQREELSKIYEKMIKNTFYDTCFSGSCE